MPVPKAIDFGMYEDGKSVYMLFEWMEGEEAEKVLPSMDKEKQYNIYAKKVKLAILTAWLKLFIKSS